MTYRIFFYSAAAQRGPWSPHFLMMFLDHTRRRTTVGRTPLDKWSARHRVLYLATHNTHNRQTDPGWVRTHNLSRRAAADLRLRPRGAATGTGTYRKYVAEQGKKISCANTARRRPPYLIKSVNCQSFLFTYEFTSDCLKNNMKIYIKIAPSCFGAVTPYSGSALSVVAKVTLC